MEEQTQLRKKSIVKALSFRNEIAEKIENEAKRENRSVSNFVETVLMRHFENNSGHQAAI